MVVLGRIVCTPSIRMPEVDIGAGIEEWITTTIDEDVAMVKEI